MITIFIPTPLRKFTGNQSSVQLRASTVLDAISALAAQFPDSRKHLFDADEQIRRFIRIYVGDEDIQQLKGAQTSLKEGDKVSIIPAIAGGSNTL